MQVTKLHYHSCQFHPILKESVISPGPLLKKPTLKDQLSSYRSISNLSLISNERVVKSRLTDHLIFNGLLKI